MANKLDPKVAEAVMIKAGLKPLEPYINSTTRWKCLHIACGEIVYPLYPNVRRGQGGCPRCGLIKSSNERKIPEKNAVAVMIKAGLKPLEPYCKSDQKWKCRHVVCGGIVYATYRQIASGKGGCKKCATQGSKLDPKVVAAIMRSHGFQQLEDYKNAKAGIRCVHLKCGNEVSPRLEKIKAGGGCGYCSRKFKRDPYESAKIMLKAGFEVLEPYRGVQVGWKSKCLKCSRIVSPTLAGIERGKGCKYCNKRFVDPAEAFEFMKSRNLLPYRPYTTASSRWKSKCLICGQDVSPRYSSILDGQGCASCAGNQIKPKDAVSVMKKANLMPLEPYEHGQKKWKCQCLNCGQIVTPTYSSVQQGQGGCIYCAKKGFDPKKPSYLYLLTNVNLNSHKVGIGKSDSKKNDRIKTFQLSGWTVHKKWQFAQGIDAWALEKQVLKVVRKELKIPKHLSKSTIGYGHGHTETVDADSISLLELERIINKLIKEYK